MSENDLSNTWTHGIEYILEEIRLNSIAISEYHKEKYYHTKGYLKYFRIPTIVFSAMNSVFSVGLQPYCPQPFISLICCLISLVCGVISSIELFLSIQTIMENELIASKDFYLLSVSIFKILSLERAMRMINGKVYLDETYQTYCKLIENSNIVSTEMKNMIKPRNFSPKMISNLKEVEECHHEEQKEEKNENNFYSLEMSLEKENIIISEIEENKKEIQHDEEEKEKESSPTLTPENEKEPISLVVDEAGNKTKRKYTKKNKEF